LPRVLDSIAAVVVGGTSLFGGRGGIGNAIVGLILLAALVINVCAQRLRAKAAD
jgi:ribose transport system permease protein